MNRVNAQTERVARALFSLSEPDRDDRRWGTPSPLTPQTPFAWHDYWLTAAEVAIEAVGGGVPDGDAHLSPEWGFESPQPGLYYVSSNDMLIETMHSARPSARLLTREVGPWREASR